MKDEEKSLTTLHREKMELLKEFNAVQSWEEQLPEMLKFFNRYGNRLNDRIQEVQTEISKRQEQQEQKEAA